MTTAERTVHLLAKPRDRRRLGVVVHEHESIDEIHAPDRRVEVPLGWYRERRFAQTLTQWRIRLEPGDELRNQLLRLREEVRSVQRLIPRLLRHVTVEVERQAVVLDDGERTEVGGHRFPDREIPKVGDTFRERFPKAGNVLFEQAAAWLETLIDGGAPRATQDAGRCRGRIHVERRRRGRATEVRPAVRDERTCLFGQWMRRTGEEVIQNRSTRCARPLDLTRERVSVDVTLDEDSEFLGARAVAPADGFGPHGVLPRGECLESARPLEVRRRPGRGVDLVRPRGRRQALERTQPSESGEPLLR